MKAALLAAGEGSRIGPLSADVPKPMLPVADRPIVTHTADAAVDAGADELVIVVGYEAEAVRTYFGDSYRETPVSYAVQHEQAGTADAVAAAREHLTDDPFAVLNGDNCYDPASITRLFEAGPAVGTIRVDDPTNYGVLETVDETVTGIVEKPDEPSSTLANAGAYVFPGQARDWLEVSESERGEREITDVLARVIETVTVSPVVLERWLDVGRPWELLEANEWQLGDLDRRFEGAVSDDAVVRGSVVVESGATVGHLSYVGDSLLGRRVNFGAGTTVANLRHDGEPVEHTVKGERVSTGRRKFGVVVGPGVKTGINSSLGPGVTLGSNATTKPGAVVDRDRRT